MQVKTHTSFQHLTSTVVQLHAAQHKENKEQAAWLDTHVPRPEAAVTTAIEEAAAEPAASGVTAEKAA